MAIKRSTKTNAWKLEQCESGYRNAVIGSWDRAWWAERADFMVWAVARFGAQRKTNVSGHYAAWRRAGQPGSERYRVALAEYHSLAYGGA